VDAKQSILTLTREVYEGPLKSNRTWVVDNDPAGGVLGTIAQITASQASAKSAGRNTIAAHVNHLLFGLRLINAITSGNEPNFNWELSWAVQSVDESQWDVLRQALESEYRQMIISFDGLNVSDEDTLTGCMAVPAHSAYHLGAIKQQLSPTGTGSA
jgi:hypothetical protein